MFRNVYFMNTLTSEQWEEIRVLRSSLSRYAHKRSNGISRSLCDGVKYKEDREELAALNIKYMITPVSIFVIMKNVKDEYLYDVVEAPPFLHQECMLPALIGFIISVLDERHNAASAFNGDKPWSFWQIKMPENKGIVRRA